MYCINNPSSATKHGLKPSPSLQNERKMLPLVLLYNLSLNIAYKLLILYFMYLTLNVVVTFVGGGSVICFRDPVEGFVEPEDDFDYHGLYSRILQQILALFGKLS